jgi:hypothetical protein
LHPYPFWALLKYQGNYTPVSNTAEGLRAALRWNFAYYEESSSWCFLSHRALAALQAIFSHPLRPLPVDTELGIEPIFVQKSSLPKNGLKRGFLVQRLQSLYRLV